MFETEGSTLQEYKDFDGDEYKVNITIICDNSHDGGGWDHPLEQDYDITFYVKDMGTDSYVLLYLNGEAHVFYYYYADFDEICKDMSDNYGGYGVKINSIEDKYPPEEYDQNERIG